MTPVAGSEPIPGYRLTRPLGEGGFGTVWEAQVRSESHPEGEFRALKFLDCRSRVSLIGSEVRVLRGLSELRHPHIIQLHGVHASGHHLILVMERGDGNLADLQQAYRDESGADMPYDDALDYLAQAAEALDFLAGLRLPLVNPSGRGLQHCDVKPSNLLLVGDVLKVADFGLCAGAGWQTHTGGWKGTPPYAAPELHGGHGVAGTDQYALAVTYCELVFGPRVFVPRRSANAPPEGMPVQLSLLRERDVPVITRALHPHPSARWPSCREFVAALRKARATSRQMRRPKFCAH